MFRHGFTLIELLLAMGIIGTLATITITAINPTRQFGQARDTQRSADVKTIASALKQHAIDNQGDIVSSVDGTLRMIGTESAGCSVGCGGDASDLPTNGIGVLWHLDEGLGTITDSSGNGMDATTISGVTYGATGRFSSGLSFDGNDYVKFPTIFPDSRPGMSEASNLDELTVSTWVRGDSPPPGGGVVVRQGWGGQFNITFNSTGGFGFNVHQTRYSGGDYNGAWHGLNTGASTFADGNWHHVSGRYHRINNTLELNVDGTSYGTYTGMSANEYLSYAPTTHPPMLGASSGYNGSPNTFLVGDVDDVAFYSRELSDAEIIGIASGEEQTEDVCLDLGTTLVNDYIASMPADPRYGSGAKTYYAVKRAGESHVEVRACGAEIAEDITVQQ